MQKEGGKVVKIAVYGTLKKGFYNHKRFRLDEYGTFLGFDTIFGYDMYDLGMYPIVVKSVSGEIKVEVYDVSTDMVATLDRMERGAGYYPTYVSTKFGHAIIWKCDEISGTKIDGGDYGKKGK